MAKEIVRYASINGELFDTEGAADRRDKLLWWEDRIDVWCDNNLEYAPKTQAIIRPSMKLFLSEQLYSGTITEPGLDTLGS